MLRFSNLWLCALYGSIIVNLAAPNFVTLRSQLHNNDDNENNDDNDVAFSVKLILVTEVNYCNMLSYTDWRPGPDYS